MKKEITFRKSLVGSLESIREFEVKRTRSLFNTNIKQLIGSDSKREPTSPEIDYTELHDFHSTQLTRARESVNSLRKS